MLLQVLIKPAPSERRGTQEAIRGLWIGPRLSAMERMSIVSFLRLGHPFELYTYAPVEDVPEGTSVCDGREILAPEEVFAYAGGPGRGSFAAFSNLFRYKLLLDGGGWWVDLDTIALRPFAFERPYIFGWQTGGSIGCGVLRAPAQSELMRECFETAKSAGREIWWGQIGPVLLTDVVQKLGLVESCEPAESFYPVPYTDWGRLVEPGGTIPESSHAVHLWHEMWRRQGWDPDAAYHPESIYGRLKARLLGVDQ